MCPMRPPPLYKLLKFVSTYLLEKECDTLVPIQHYEQEEKLKELPIDDTI